MKKILKLTLKIVIGLIAACLYMMMFFYIQPYDKEPTEMPVFSDVTDENRIFVETVYRNHIMPASGGGAFGVDKPFSRSEAAYTAVWLYEQSNGIEYTWTGFDPENGEYIAKAEEYGIWPELGGSDEDNLTREQAAAVYSGFTDGAADVNELTEFTGMENYVFAEQALKMFNKGVFTEEKIADAFSPELVLTRGEAARIISMILNPALRQMSTVKDYDGLSALLASMLEARQGDWSLYFLNYDSGEEISINSHQVYSASLIKLYVIQSVYQKISEGQMSDTYEIESLLARMITYSDNNAWSSLAKRLGGGSYKAGMAYVTDVAAASGFGDTGQFYQGTHRNYNFTSVNDCGAYLKGILDGTIVSPEYSEKILDYLKQQEHTQKLPSGVPDGVVVANKTGELEYNQGDAAIVYSPGATYILVLIGDDLMNAYGTIPFFGDVSRAVYNFINE